MQFLQRNDGLASKNAKRRNITNVSFKTKAEAKYNHDSFLPGLLSTKAQPGGGGG